MWNTRAVTTAASKTAVAYRRAPFWRVVLGGVLGAIGTLLTLLPATIAGGLAQDYKTGACYNPGDHLFGDMCHITAVEAYGVMMVLLVAPSVVGLLVAFPRRVAWYLGALVVAAVAVYLVLVFSGETLGPPREHYHDPSTFGG